MVVEKKEKKTQPTRTTKMKTCTRRNQNGPNPSKKRRRSNTHHSPRTTWCGCACVDSHGGQPKYVHETMKTARNWKPCRRTRRKNDTRNQPNAGGGGTGRSTNTDERKDAYATWKRPETDRREIARCHAGDGRKPSQYAPAEREEKQRRPTRAVLRFQRFVRPSHGVEVRGKREIERNGY